MPNCFQLFRDGEAVPLMLIDQEMCWHFRSSCNDTMYFHGWFDWIGYDRSWDWIHDRLKELLWRSVAEDKEKKRSAAETIYCFEWLILINKWLRSKFQPNS